MKGKAERENRFWVSCYEFRVACVSQLQILNSKPSTVFAPCAGITLIRFYGFDLSLLLTLILRLSKKAPR